MGLLEKLVFILSFGFSKICQTCSYLQLGTKKTFVLFLEVLCDSHFLLIFFPHRLTVHCHKCIFHMNNTTDLVGTVKFVERISYQNDTSENISKKWHLLFSIPSWSV